MIRLITILFYPFAFLIGLVFVLPFCKRYYPVGINWTQWYAWRPVTDYNGKARWLHKVWRRRTTGGELVYNLTPHYGMVGDK
jgi:hypothetical protein